MDDKEKAELEALKAQLAKAQEALKAAEAASAKANADMEAAAKAKASPPVQIKKDEIAAASEATLSALHASIEALRAQIAEQASGKGKSKQFLEGVL